MTSRRKYPSGQKRKASAHFSDEDSSDSSNEVEAESSSDDSKRGRRVKSSQKIKTRRSTER